MKTSSDQSRQRDGKWVASVEMEVPFHDVDQFFVVWHGHYYKYFEIARTALFRAHGVDCVELLRSGYRTLVTESKCRYYAPLRYGDRLVVEACFKSVEHGLHIGFEIKNVTTGELAARGHTVLAALDSHGGLLLETPASLRDRLQT